MMTADALAASLDAHSSLRLITDAVHELDDALCLALTWRVLRDALGARFPTCPRAGGRGPGGGRARGEGDRHREARPQL
jgi:hypothetical protein